MSNFKSEKEHGPVDLLQHNLEEYWANRKPLTSGTRNGLQLVAKQVKGSNAVKAVAEMISGTMTPTLSSTISNAVSSGVSSKTISHSTSKGKFTIKLYKSGSVYTISVGK